MPIGDKPYMREYLQDVIELMEAVFAEISSQDKWDFEKFVSGFMSCKYRKLIDEGAARVMNMAIDEFIMYLHRDCEYIFVPGECLIDPILARWLGGMYNRLQYALNISSEEIYKVLPLEKMVILFRPLHTVDEEVALKKLIGFF